MKKLLPVLSALILLASCDNDGYTIKGSFPGAEDGTVVYMTAADEFFTTIDSAVINNGCFEFKGGYYDRILRMLLVPGKAVGGPVVVEKGVINVKIDKTIERGGTEGNAILQRFMDASEHYEGLVDITSPTYVKSMPLDKNVYDSLVVERDKAAGALAAFAYLAIENNIDNSLGLFLITKSYKLVDAEKMAPLLERVPSYLRNARYDVVNDYVSVALASKKQKEAVSVGSVYLNFELPDISGKKVLFSSVVGENRYTLLQFWASWCAPCRRELPAIDALYKKYAKKGLAVVGLSLDSCADEWRSAAASLSSSWVQLCSPSGGSSEVAAAYGIDVIPSNLLINNKGTIIARDITPAELDSLLAGTLE